MDSFLSGQGSFANIVEETDIKNLSVVCSGPHPPNPAELLSSHKMKEFVETSTAKFDFILYDTAPMVVVTDAIILSQIIDGTIIVLESGQTHRRVLPRFVQLLKNAKARVIGVLLNKISIAGNRYYYYYSSEKPQKPVNDKKAR